ncbi:MAG: PhnD/SsuA/transferrin family substrate-binding protein [Faecalibacterium sp.]
MKKITRRSFLLATAGATAALALTACASDEATSTTDENGAIIIDTLSVAFVPSKDPDEIITATEPLEEMLITELAPLGYNVGSVNITVGTTYEAVGEALSAGTADVGLIPGSTYVLYDDGADVILTATRDGLSKDSDDAADWNDGEATTASENQALSYRALMVAGPSEKGMELADIVNGGGELTWDDINSANWGLMSTTSPAGYVYPTIWMMDNYDMKLTDLSSAVTSDSYGTAFARLASGQLDVIAIYADARRDFEAAWNDEYAREASIWAETNVIGVTPGIYNDTVSVSKNSAIMDEAFIAALQTAFINIGNTEEGKEVIAVYSHNGYQVATSADYDNERKAQEIILSMNEG